MMTRVDLLARSVLMVPSVVPRFIEKAPEAGADIICLDLEDSVPPDQKAAARLAACSTIEVLAARSGPVWVRVNAWSTGLLEDDLEAVIHPGLGGVMISKAESAESMRRAEAMVSNLEKARGLPAGEVGLVPLIETARGVLASPEIVAANRRIIAAAFGAEDFCTDLGVKRTRAGEEIRWPRAQISVSCAAAGIAAIDAADVVYQDSEYFENEAQYARGVGFTGKLCIHPNQVQIANLAFGVTENDVQHARAVVFAFEQEGLAKGRAAIALDGRMVDTPHYEAAKRVLALAERLRGA